MNFSNQPLLALNSVTATSWPHFSSCIISAFCIINFLDTLRPLERLLCTHSSSSSSNASSRGFLPAPGIVFLSGPLVCSSLTNKDFLPSHSRIRFLSTWNFSAAFLLLFCSEQFTASTLNCSEYCLFFPPLWEVDFSEDSVIRRIKEKHVRAGLNYTTVIWCFRKCGLVIAQRTLHNSISEIMARVNTPVVHWNYAYVIDFPTVIRGHRIYKTDWTPAKGEILICQKDDREEAKLYDEHAIGIYQNDSLLVGHVPIELSFIICCFLRAHNKNSLLVRVTGPRKLENGLVVPGCFTAFTQSAEMGRLKRELLRVQELCKHMDLDINECELEKKKLIFLIWHKNNFVINTRCHCRFLSQSRLFRWKQGGGGGRLFQITWSRGGGNTCPFFSTFLLLVSYHWCARRYGLLGSVFDYFSKLVIRHCVITEVKPGRAGLALGWVTAREYAVSWGPFFFARGHGDFNTGRTKPFWHPRRAFGCEGNPKH